MNKQKFNFKVGDEVICIDPIKSSYYLKKDGKYTVAAVGVTIENNPLIQLKETNGGCGEPEKPLFYSDRFKLAPKELLTRSEVEEYDYELVNAFQPVVIKTRNGMVTLFTDDHGTTVMAYEGMKMRDEADHAYQLTWVDKRLPVGKWMLWSEVDFSDEERYAIHAHSQMEIGCVSESTKDDMLEDMMPGNDGAITDAEVYKITDAEVYKADNIEGASRLFDAADVVSAAQKASGCNNCHLVFKITRV